MSKPEIQDTKRRDFLRSSTLLGAGASLIASGTASAMSTDELPATETAKPVKENKGYQLSEHVKAYYRIAAS